MQALRYRFNFTEVRIPSRADAVQLSEIRLLQPNGQRHLFGYLGALNPMGNNPPTQGPLNLIDDSLYTKWLDFNMVSRGNSLLELMLQLLLLLQLLKPL